MTEPTDAELDELRQANSGKLNFVTFSEFRTIARAVLAKWGTPQPVAREPLTHEQIKVTAGDHKIPIRQTRAFIIGARFAEQHHGITGGQHGTE